MVQATQQAAPELTEDLEYQSRVTDDLLVMGTQDKDKFNEIRGATTKKLLGTHSQSFHCDEVLATAMLL